MSTSPPDPSKLNRRILPANYRPEQQIRPAVPSVNQPRPWTEQRRQRAGTTSATSGAETSTRTSAFASLPARAVAYSIDLIVVWLLWYALPALGAMLVHGSRDLGTDLLGAIWTIGWPIVYFGILTGARRRTLGMIVVRTRVVCEDDSPVPVFTALVRAALFQIGFLVVVPFLANWAFMLTGRRQGYHDLLTHTVMLQE